MHKASENLQTAIEKGRTDIVRTIIEACQKCKLFYYIDIRFLTQPVFKKILYYRSIKVAYKIAHLGGEEKGEFSFGITAIHSLMTLVKNIIIVYLNLQTNYLFPERKCLCLSCRIQTKSTSNP